MLINPEIGDRTAYAYIMYRVVEYKGPRKEACANCDLPAGLCDPLRDNLLPITCRPEQRNDGKQVVFKRRYNIKKRERRLQK